MKPVNDKRKRLLAIIKLVILAGLIAGIPLYFYFRFGSEMFSRDRVYSLESYLMAHRSGAALTLILLQIIQVLVCFLPGQPVQIAASYIFGILPGFLLSISGAVIGTALSFGLAAILGRNAVEFLFDSDKVSNYHDKLNSGRGLLIVLLIYLIPGCPKDLVSYVAGISGMRFRPFLLVSSIGRSPGMLGSLLLGYFLGTRNYQAIAVLAAITAVILVIVLIKRKDVLALLDNIAAREDARMHQKGQ